eukprot:TRINITY_DN671_c0_g1_i2.p3 TRINITY_DN671_c0_g1~~TRINITY_DN671_c0_g1_i2.p3  ORF type:complete len:51 (+),score=1.19 TRINITY_DN671_c0_g1_i2:307-459(+)
MQIRRFFCPDIAIIPFDLKSTLRKFSPLFFKINGIPLYVAAINYIIFVVI